MTQRVSLHYAAVGAESDEALERSWLPRLPAAKRASVLRIRDPMGRNASLLGVALLESALAEIGIALDSESLGYPLNGKPQLAGGPDFSISHTRGLVACAVAERGRIGLDLEATGSVAPATAARVLDTKERAALDRGALDPTDAWVMKEAVVKLHGRGIGALASVHLRAHQALLEGATAWLHRLTLAHGYTAWLASDAASSQIRVRAHDRGAAPLPSGR